VLLRTGAVSGAMVPLSEEDHAVADERLRAIVELIEQEYETEIVPITVASRTLQFFRIRDLDEVVFDRLTADENNLLELPFWGKIWEASIFLASYLAMQPMVPERQILEIGAGMGVSGLFAAACGHRITLSDHKEEVLRFTRANALLNDLAHVPIIRIDWREPPPEERYDWIVGSEVVYHRPSYDALIQFLDQALKPQGTIILAKRTDLPASEFFVRLTQRFQFKKMDRVMRGRNEQYSFSLYAIKRKGEA